MIVESTQCKIEDCATSHHIKRGYCNMHYKRFLKYGDPLFRKNARGSINHGMSRTPTWYSWIGMIERTTSKKYKQYMDYSGRGIVACERWTSENGFINFLEDMGLRPDGKTLDRIDNDGNYERTGKQQKG